MSKMRNGIVKRGSTYSCVVRVKDPATGASKPVWEGGFKSHAEAVDRRDEAREALRKGTYIRRTHETVGDYLMSWLGQVDVRPKTLDGYAYNVHHYVRPYLGAVPLHDLTGPMLSSFYADLRLRGGRNGGELGWRSVQAVHRTLSSALSSATASGLLINNPADRAVLPPKPRPATREEWEARNLQIFTPTELTTFLKVASAHRLGAFFHLAAYTGARRGELLYLRWGDVDLDNRTIDLLGSRTQAGGKAVEGPTKGGKPRRVTIDPLTVEVLRTHRAAQAAERLRAGPLWDDAGDYIFTRPAGRPIHLDTPSSLMPKLCRAAKVPVIRLHDLRHTHASILLSAGRPPHEVAERLGHRDATVTLQVYAQVLRERSAGLGDAFAAAISEGLG